MLGLGEDLTGTRLENFPQALFLDSFLFADHPPRPARRTHRRSQSQVRFRRATRRAATLIRQPVVGSKPFCLAPPRVATVQGTGRREGYNRENNCGSLIDISPPSRFHKLASVIAGASKISLVSPSHSRSCRLI